jgi:hypothetical protein
MLEPPRDGGVLGAPGAVEEEHEAASDDADDEEIGQGKVVPDEVGVGAQVVLHDLEALQRGVHALLNFLLVEGPAADQRVEPAAEGGEDLGVGEGHPPQDGGVVLLRVAEESGPLVLRRDCSKVVGSADIHHRVGMLQSGAALTIDGDGDALGQHVAIGAHKSGDFGERIEFAVVVARFLGRWDGLKVQVEVIGLGDGEDGGRPRVVLFQ